MEIKTIKNSVVVEKKCANKDSIPNCRLPDEIPECYNDCTNFKQVESKDDIVVEIKLSLVEAEAILHSLMRTRCKGEELTISMQLEDELFDKIKDYI